MEEENARLEAEREKQEEEGYEEPDLHLDDIGDLN
jgi:hypothetical protein